MIFRIDFSRQQISWCGCRDTGLALKQTPAQRGGLSSTLAPQEGRSDTRRGPGKGAGRRPPGGRSRSRGLARGQGHGWSLQPHPRLPAGASATSPWVPARRPGDLSRGHDGPQEEAAAPAGAVTQERPTVAQGRPTWPWSTPCPLGLSVPIRQ